MDIVPVRRCFYVACNSVITRSHGVAEPLRVQLIKSFCLPLLVYCIGALSLKRSAIHMLSVCWNNTFRRILTIKSKSFRILQVSFRMNMLYHILHLYVKRVVLVKQKTSKSRPFDNATAGKNTPALSKKIHV